MKTVTHYKMVTTTYAVKVEVADDAELTDISYHARLARELHGEGGFVEDKTVIKEWYVEENERLEKFGNPFYD